MAERRTLTRADLRDAAFQASEATSAEDVRQIVDQVFEAIADELVDRSGEVKISRFGNFVVVRAQSRIGRNPRRPAEAHAIPAHSRVAFRPSLELRALVNGEEP
jgi:nucleoid DNA-binding protein